MVIIKAVVCVGQVKSNKAPATPQQAEAHTTIRRA